MQIRTMFFILTTVDMGHNTNFISENSEPCRNFPEEHIQVDSTGNH